MYGDVVMGVQKLPSEDHDPFEEIIENFKAEIFPKEKGEVDDSKISAAQMKELVQRFKTLVKKRSGKDFPNCPWEQLEGSVGLPERDSGRRLTCRRCLALSQLTRP